MSAIKIAVTLDDDLLSKLDRYAAQRRLPDRDAAAREALRDRFENLDAAGRSGDAADRRAVADRIDALRDRLAARYGEFSESAELVREDRDR
jgi:predicted transcriptional regulator